MRLGAGVLDVYSCWWAWAETIWPVDVGPVVSGPVVVGAVEVDPVVNGERGWFGNA